MGREATWPLVVSCASFLCLETLTKPGLELPAAAQSWEPFPLLTVELTATSVVSGASPTTHGRVLPGYTVLVSHCSRRQLSVAL